MRRRSSVIGILALAAALPAAGSTFLALSPEELAAEAGAVVEARVQAVRSFWNGAGTVILTEALLRVDEVVVGDAAPEVVVRSFGGTVAGYTLEAHGFPTFQRGERLLLYLYREGADGSVRVLGYQQGQYRIETREDGSEVAVPALAEGTRLLTRTGRPTPPARPLLLDELKQGIRAAALRGGRIDF